MGRVRERRRERRRVRIGAPDRSLTRFSGLAAVTELIDRLDVIGTLDTAIGPIKTRAGGLSAGDVLTGLATAQLAGAEFLVGLDRHRADVAGQELTPVPGLASTTAAGLARRLSDGQWRAVETGLGDVHAAALDTLAVADPARAAQLAGPDAAVTIDLDATDVEVYGRLKQGVAYNHQGQRVGRPHVAVWADASTVLAADLLSGREDPRSHSADLLTRALAALPAAARGGRVRVRADAGYFAGALTRACQLAGVGFAIGAPRIAPLWRLLDGLSDDNESAWHDAIAMGGAQVAVADYCPPWWPAGTRLLIRRVRLDPGTGEPAAQITGNLRARRRRTLHPDQRGLPLPALAQLALAAPIYGYSFIVTNLEVTGAEQALAVEHWYRHRTQIENLFRDTKIGAALRHLPSGDQQVNQAWMWGGLLAATLTGWLHHLTAQVEPDGRLCGHGVRGGQAMIATLRQRLIAIPARLIHHGGATILRLPPGEDLLAEILARIRALPAAS